MKNLGRAPLWEGPCAYAVRLGDGAFEIIVYGSNSITHVVAGNVPAGEPDRAERVCLRLNAYPERTRRFHGLL